MTSSLTIRHHSARLSVILISTGPTSVLEGAIARLRVRLASLDAHLVVVRSDEAHFSRRELDLIPGSVVIRAPHDSTRDEAVGLAMPHAIGDIVAIREDHEVADAQWVDAFRGSVPSRAEKELPVGRTDDRTALAPPSLDRRPDRRTHSRDA